MGTQRRYSPEVRERAVRMVREHEREHDSQWAAIRSIAGKIGCSAETLRGWVRQGERDIGQRAGLTTEEKQRLKELGHYRLGVDGDWGRGSHDALQSFKRQNALPANDHWDEETQRRLFAGTRY